MPKIAIRVRPYFEGLAGKGYTPEQMIAIAVERKRAHKKQKYDENLARLRNERALEKMRKQANERAKREAEHQAAIKESLRRADARDSYLRSIGKEPLPRGLPEGFFKWPERKKQLWRDGDELDHRRLLGLD